MTTKTADKFHAEAGIPGDTFEIEGHLWVCDRDPRSEQYSSSYPALHWVSPSCMYTVCVGPKWKSDPYGVSFNTLSYATRERAALAAMKQHQIELAKAKALVRKWDNA